MFLQSLDSFAWFSKTYFLSDSTFCSLLTKSVRWIHNWTFSRRRNANVWDSLASASCLWNPQARTHTRCFPPGNKVQQVLAQCRSNIQAASNLSVPRPCRWIPMHPAAPWTWQLLGAPWGALTAPSTARWHLSRILFQQLHSWTGGSWTVWWWYLLLLVWRFN